MARRRNLLKHPRNYLADGGEWPAGPFKQQLPPEARLARALARRLETARGNKSRQEVGRLAKVHCQTVINVLEGRTWGDLVTISRLERGLKTELWGDEHREDRSARPRDYLTDDGVWPDGPLVIGAPLEARLALAVVRRLTDAGGADELAHVHVPGVNRADLENFINGYTWGDLRVVAVLEQVVNSPLWGYEHLSIRQPLDDLDAGQTWPEGRLRPNAPDEAHAYKKLAERLQQVCPTHSPEQLARQADVSVVGVLEIVQGTGWSDYATLRRITTTLDQLLPTRPPAQQPAAAPEHADPPARTPKRREQTRTGPRATYPLPSPAPEDGIDPNDIHLIIPPATPSRRVPHDRWKQKPEQR